jgi:hypothetical protein
MNFRLPTIALAAQALWLLVGCDGKTPTPKDAGPPAPAQTVITSGDNKGLAELSEEDRKLAEKQRVCPVTDEPLGSMGKPVKMTLKGRTVFLCCEGCRDEIEQNADKYLAKLDEAAKKRAEAKQ